MAVRFPDPIHPVDPVELEINQLFDHLVICLNQRRVALLTTYRDTRDQIAARRIACERKEGELIGMKAETQARLQMNELRELQERLLYEIEQTLAEVRVPQRETRVVFRGNRGHLEQVIAGVGEVVEEELPVVPRYEEMRPIVAVGKTGQATGELYGPCGVAPGELFRPYGVAVDENTNLIYVVEGLHCCRVSIFSETGEFINTFTHHDMLWPHGIAIHRDNLYVTDPGVNAVFHFKIEADMRLVAKVGSRGSGMGQIYGPYGLTVSTNGDVFVAEVSNHRIQILDDSLHFQRFITHQTMKCPYDVKLTPDEVYVLCECSPSILVFSHAGEKIRSLITQATGMQIGMLTRMQIGTAYYFCLDRKQNLLISDWDNHEVRIFSKEGTHLHTIGKKGHGVGMFRSPQGIVLTKNLKLIIVSINKNYRLQIYSCQ